VNAEEEPPDTSSEVGATMGCRHMSMRKRTRGYRLTATTKSTTTICWKMKKR
jgi:hypothetical protein